eukprot:TRINITY_DN464_c0_g1_i1.p1 TRINITY_DN464_c0_g1~~TRINITY_DN464_c0_g1_i1.p1  ORF type:complete len:1664 (+),score=604.92 TRINITY_DN464_c0_g1_i1:191-5182(+)
MPSTAWNKTTFLKLLDTIRSNSDSHWVDKCKFQTDLVAMSLEKLRKRAIGWLTHHNVYDDESDKNFQTAWEAFEKKHFHAYKRWKKMTGASGGFDLATQRSLEDSLNDILFYYLVYAEVNDFRNLKNVFHMFFHLAFSFKENKQFGEIGTFLRTEGTKLYRFLGLVYSKDEMNDQCFHHDDLDDLCINRSFCKSMLTTKDWYQALGVKKFPHLSTVLELDTPTFIVFWLKSSQGELTPERRKARDEWIQEKFCTEDQKKQLTEWKAKLDALTPQIDQAQAELKREEEAMNSADRYRPKETDFDGKPDALVIYRSSLAQLNTARTLLSNSEDLEAKKVSTKVRQSQVNNFTDRKAAEAGYNDALSQYQNLVQSYSDCEMSLRRACEGFSSNPAFQNCKSFASEAKQLQARSKWKRLNAEQQQHRIKILMMIHFAYIDTINKERYRYADNWKTFREKSAGPGGMTGYFTVWYHFSTVAYLHLLMLAPIAWLYFDYQNIIGNELKAGGSGFGGGISKLLNFGDLMNVKANPIIPVGAPIALAIVLMLICNFGCRWRTRGPKSGTRRDAGCKSNMEWGPRWRTFLLWVLIIISEVALMKGLILNPIRTATDEWIEDFDFASSLPYILINWIPVIFLYICSVQFIHTCWISFFGFFAGLIDGVSNCKSWGDLIYSFHPSGEFVKGDHGPIPIPKIVFQWHEKVMPKPGKNQKKEKIGKEDQEVKTETENMRKYVAFAKVWNATVNYFYDIHKLSQEELQRYTFKIRTNDESGADFLSDRVEKEPELKEAPKVKEVRYHLCRFINNIRMDKPTTNTAVINMLPLNVITPVGAEKILYPFEFVISVDNTQSSFLQHLINNEPSEWENFKAKECLSEKARDWISRMEKDVLQGLTNADKKNKKTKRWIDSTEEGQNLKMAICEWASCRFQALFRTVHGFMQVPVALALLARIQNPKINQEEAEEIARSKFSYLVGYQSYASYKNKYKKSKTAGKEGMSLAKDDWEAHEAVYFVKHLRKRFPELRICYPDQENGVYLGRMMSGSKNSGSGRQIITNYKTTLFGPFADFGLGKPTHQNFMSQFIDGCIVQTIDINQDSVLPQSFLVPNILGEFDLDPLVKIIGCPEFIVTMGWSSTAWCSAFSERTFGTLTQRCYSRLGIRLHYGHPDYIDAFWIQTETGLSKLPYVSEDIFTGFDTVLKGGKVIHREYHEVGKARDVDLYTTTKFQRKISMGASQLACSRYIDQLTTSWSVSTFQSLSYYYSTVGHYQNHAILWVSVWFALIAQLLLIILQKFVFQERIAYFVTERIFTFQVGYFFMVPGVLQLILEFGVIWGLWTFISNFIINYVYSTFHILNVASYWQFGLTNSAFYLASGRGTGLEHHFMLDMYDNFYSTHWGPAFVIFWMGFLVLILSGNVLVWAVMYLLPSGIWLWGAMALNPGSLPSSVHEEQWKRLMNEDMKQSSLIVKKHTKIDEYRYDPIKGNGMKRFFIKIGRGIKYAWKVIIWVYTAVNFAIHTRVTRLFAVLVIFYKWVFSARIPTFIFTDERRRMLRWDEDETRQKSIFFSSIIRDQREQEDHDRESQPVPPRKPSKPVAKPGAKPKPAPPAILPKRGIIQTTSESEMVEDSGSSRPLPAPPAGSKPRPKPKRNRSVRFLGKEGEKEGSSDEGNIQFKN